MEFHVCNEMTLERKSFSALLKVKVHENRVFPVELQLTNLAHEGAIARMDSRVSQQMMLEGEAFFAFRALIRPE
jgi:hypothetical protein